MKLPDEIAKMFRDFEQDNLRRSMDAAKANPKAHRLTTVMGKAKCSHRYWPGGKDGNGNGVYFCVADFVNVAGYILTWREVHYRKPVKRNGSKCTMCRDQWAARKSHAAAVKLAKARAARMQTAKKGAAN